MTTSSPSHRIVALGIAVAAALSTGACSASSEKKADATSGVGTTVPAGATTSSLPSTSVPVVPDPPATTVPPTTALPVKPKVELRGDDLAVTRVGAPFREAVEAISGALGRPSADPTLDTGCISADVEAEWSGFRLAGNDGKVSGWSSTRKELKTPSDVGIGTTVATLKRVYGDKFFTEAASPDSGVLWGVKGVNLFGGLSGTANTDRVDYFFNGACSPP